MNAAAEKKKTGRPPVDIDAKILRALRAVHCTETEIADHFGISKRQLIRRIKSPDLREAWDAGVSQGNVSLRRLQWRHAQMPNSAGVNMTIHLSKHWLGETDKSALELSGRVDGQVEVTTARERVNRKLDTLAERITSRVAGIAAAAGAQQATAGAE